MVFLNMGGPSTTADVGDFLSRLFVSLFLLYLGAAADRLVRSRTVISFHLVDYKTTLVP